MPDATAGPFWLSWNTHVATGPVTAEATMAGTQISGFFTMFPICSMEVPRPCDSRPPQRFSRKLSTAKPTIWAQHPASAAPPASPVSPRAAQMAADEMGSVSAMPMTTDTMTPMKKGCSSVAHMMNPPTDEASAPIHGAATSARPQPPRMVTAGVTMMSTFVSLDTALPSSEAITATTSTAKGPPAPPASLAAKPTAASENSTSGGVCSAYPMAMAMAGPATLLANVPIWLKNAKPERSPTVLRMVPMRSEANRPCAMADNASMA